MAVPENAAPIFAVLVQGGLTPVAAAGVLGNIQEESTGHLNSVGTGGCGLLGYTPCSSAPPGGAVTEGGPNPSVEAQAQAVIAYVQNSYPGGVAALDAIQDPGDAGASFAHLGERCAACGYQGGTGQLAVRAQNARDVYAAYQAGTLGKPTQGSAGGTDTSSDGALKPGQTDCGSGKHVGPGTGCGCCPCSLCLTLNIAGAGLPPSCLITLGQLKALRSGLVTGAGGGITLAGVVLLAAFALRQSGAVNAVGAVLPFLL